MAEHVEMRRKEALDRRPIAIAIVGTLLGCQAILGLEEGKERPAGEGGATGSTTGSSAGSTTGSSAGSTTGSSAGSTTGGSTGTSSTSQSSAAGSGGTGGAGGGPTNLVLQYRVQSSGAMTTSIGSELWIVNHGSSSVNLNDLTLRYYFTNEVTAALSQNINWANISPINGSMMTFSISKMTITTVKMAVPVPSSADTYVEIGFNAGGDVLAPDHQMQFSWTVQNFASENFNQPGDYSFNPGATSPINWQNVVLLFQGQSVVWGVEP